MLALALAVAAPRPPFRANFLSLERACLLYTVKSLAQELLNSFPENEKQRDGYIYMPSMELHDLASHILTECDDPGALPIPSASYMITAIGRSSDLVGCWADASGDLMHLARLPNLGLAH